jgi:uncharacterized protein (TIGR02594 family)
MKLVVRAAVGCVFLSMAAPTVSLADVEANNNAMNFYNTQGGYAASGAKSARHARGRNARAARHAPAPAMAQPAFGFAAGGNPNWINVARQYKGTNPTKRRSLWCADFLNLVLERSGKQGTSSSMAGSFIGYGQRLSGPKVGAIAVIGRGRGAAHVGIVTGLDDGGNPVIISGNHNNTVAEATYSAGRVIAYVWPAG